MQSALAAVGLPEAPGAGPARSSYEPGVCNIGPAEIARRRTAGRVGLAVTVILLATLVAVGAPPLTRLVLVLPAAGAASGYLQAWLRFCAGFGSRGVFNFGVPGQTEGVADPVDRAADRARATQIGVASLVVGVVVGVAAALLPL
ncbi:MAG TPA: hypothetical protein VHM48_04690 [Candidatus Limnocylindrales bacterium]|nr:hypothetical protein [Candidatus Limnocylindrales bacterium]